MTIEIVDFPIKHGGSFHSFSYVYQRVTRGRFSIGLRLIYITKKGDTWGILYLFFLGVNWVKPIVINLPFGGVVVKNIQTKGHVGLV